MAAYNQCSLNQTLQFMLLCNMIDSYVNCLQPEAFRVLSKETNLY